MEQILNFALVDEDVLVIKNLQENLEYGFSAFKPGISQKWEIVKILCSSAVCSESQKKSFVDKLSEEDQTDTKIEFKAKIDALIATPEQKMEIFESCAKPDTELSADIIAHTLRGLNSSCLPESHRKLVFERYGELIFEIVKNRSMAIADSFLSVLIPKLDDLTAFHSKVQNAYEQLEPTDKYA